MRPEAQGRRRQDGASVLEAANSTDVAAGTRFGCVQIKPSALPCATASCREDAPSLR